MQTKTRAAEDEIGQVVVRFERDFMGRGWVEARAFLLDDLVLVRLRNVLTPAEHAMAACPAVARGRDLIKQLRRRLVESEAERLYAEIYSVLGVPVRTMHADVCTRTGEGVFVIVLADKPTVTGD